MVRCTWMLESCKYCLIVGYCTPKNDVNNCENGDKFKATVVGNASVDRDNNNNVILI